ncbi:MAG TPA: histidine kinase [Gemmatimonadaceae bacterium]|jgi:signal transduction histidine kinase|nr:histidine kinase [Gemmatimonadaceae bacterium]
MQAARIGTTREGAVFWTGVGIIWTLLVALSVGETALYMAHAGEAIPWARIIAEPLVHWGSFGVFIPALFWLARKFPLERGHWGRSVLAQLTASVLCVPVQFLLYLLLAGRLVEPGDSLFDLLRSKGLPELRAFWALIGVINAVQFYRRLRERDASALRLEAQLADAQMRALTARLRPHFLFNTLGAISELVHHDPVGADQMIARLSHLLRATLTRPDHHQITLGDELALSTHFIDIMRVRYGPRLSVDILVEPALRGALVPSLLLQPLIENALEHGAAQRRGSAQVTIGVERVGPTTDYPELTARQALRLIVTDNGPGFPQGDINEGIGLSTTRERLSQLYGARQSFLIENGTNGGARAIITIPLEWEAVGDPSIEKSECAGS